MRTALFIAVCFSIVVLLPFIPDRTITPEGIIIHPEGMLPGLLNFSIICAVILVTVIIFTQYRFRQKLNGQLVLKRRDMNLAEQLPLLVSCVVLLLILQFLPRGYFYFLIGLTPYFSIILGTIAFYFILKKWSIRYARPDFLAIDGKLICIKTFLRNKNREIKNLKIAGYNSKSNTLSLQFQEGLENINLHLSDYNFSELQDLVRSIKKENTGTIQIDDSLKNLLER